MIADWLSERWELISFILLSIKLNGINLIVFYTKICSTFILCSAIFILFFILFFILIYLFYLFQIMWLRIWIFPWVTLRAESAEKRLQFWPTRGATFAASTTARASGISTAQYAAKSLTAFGHTTTICARRTMSLRKVLTINLIENWNILFSNQNIVKS